VYKKYWRSWINAARHIFIRLELKIHSHCLTVCCWYICKLAASIVPAHYFRLSKKSRFILLSRYLITDKNPTLSCSVFLVFARDNGINRTLSNFWFSYSSCSYWYISHRESFDCLHALQCLWYHVKKSSTTFRWFLQMIFPTQTPSPGENQVF
jgi:hypothetical protein